MVSPSTTKATDSSFTGTPRTIPRIPIHQHGFANDNHGYRFTFRGYTKDKFQGSRHICKASPRISRLPIHFSRVHQGQCRGSQILHALHQRRFQGYRIKCTASPRTSLATDSFHTGTPRTIPRIPTHPRGFAKDNQGY